MIKKEETEMRDTFFVVTTCILFDFFFKIDSIGIFIEEIQSNIDTVLPVYILVDTIKTNFKNFTRFR